MSVPPSVKYYEVKTGSQPREPIYVRIPEKQSAAEDDRPEWLVLIPK